LPPDYFFCSLIFTADRDNLPGFYGVSNRGLVTKNRVSMNKIRAIGGSGIVTLVLNIVSLFVCFFVSTVSPLEQTLSKPDASYQTELLRILRRPQDLFLVEQDSSANFATWRFGFTSVLSRITHLSKPRLKSICDARVRG
jgi:hypothetical protein